MIHKTAALLIVIFVVCALTVVSAGADGEKWWPVELRDIKDGSERIIEYVPLLEKASKKWNVVALMPHMKDKTWLAADYGLVSEAKRLGIKLTIWEAGGYTNLPKQLSQYDDAVAMGADAILIGLISEAGMNKKIKEGKAKGILNVSYINPSFEAPFDARIQNDLKFFGHTSADLVLKYYQDRDKVRILQFPGPAGSGWAEALAKFFREPLEKAAPGKFIFLDDKYGDTGKSVQLRLVEDTLQAYENVDLLHGNTPMCEVAVKTIREMGLSDKVKVSASYDSEDLVPHIKRGDIIGMIAEFNSMIAMVALNETVRKLEKKHSSYGNVLGPVSMAITKDNIDTVPWNLSYAPRNFKPVYSVK